MTQFHCGMNEKGKFLKKGRVNFRIFASAKGHPLEVQLHNPEVPLPVEVANLWNLWQNLASSGQFYPQEE